MSCNSCNDNNTIPTPTDVVDPCNPCENPCDSCGTCDCECEDPGYMNDGCYATQNTDCVTLKEDITCLELEEGDTLTEALSTIVEYAKDTLTRLTSDSLVITQTDDDCDDKATIELVPSSDDGNILTLGDDGKPYVPTPNTDSVLSFENALTGPDAGVVRWGGFLTQDTEVSFDGFTTSFSRDDAQTFWDTDYYKNFAKSDEYVSYEEFTSSTQLRFVSDFAAWDDATLTQHFSFSYMNENESTMGYNYPYDFSSWDPLETSYFRATDHRATIYANLISRTSPEATQTTGALVSGETYRIIESTNGTDFSASGAASNAVGTAFTANGVTPVWQAGDELRKIPIIEDRTVHVTTQQNDTTWINLAYADFSPSAPEDLVGIMFNRADLFTAAIDSQADRNAGGALYHFGQISIKVNDANTLSGASKIGWYIPDTLSSIIDAPAVDPDITTYAEYRNGVINNYGAAIRINTGGVIIRPISDTSSTPHASAALQIVSTTQGLLPPKMTTGQKNAISATAGLIVYDTTLNKLQCYDGSAWQSLF